MKVSKFDLYVKKHLFSIFLSIFTGLLVYLVIMNTIKYSLKDLDDDLQTIKDMSEKTLERIINIKEVHADLKKKLSTRLRTLFYTPPVPICLSEGPR